jgi:hypothetical protein
LTKSLELARELGYKDASLIEEHGEDIAKAYEEKRYDDIGGWLKDLYVIRYLDLSDALAKLIEHSLEKGRTLFQRTE